MQGKVEEIAHKILAAAKELNLRQAEDQPELRRQQVTSRLF